MNEKLIQLFFVIAACSWMPHLSCHFYRLETHSSFVVGTYSYSRLDSFISIGIYLVFVLLNVFSVVFGRIRVFSALVSGIFHLLLASIHMYRLMHWFTFIVFGYAWPKESTILEISLIGPFGIICITMAVYLWRRRVC
jgi:hypothetical protein